MDEPILRRFSNPVRAAGFFLAGLLVLASLTVNFLQARRIWALRQELGEAKAQGELTPGASFSEIKAVDWLGKPAVVEFRSSERPTVIYVFRPSCAWCERNSASFSELSRLVSAKYRVIGLSLAEEGLPDFVNRNHMKFAVYTGISAATVAQYHLGTTPETIVVSPAGTVLQDWRGAYIGPLRTLVENFFGIAFPPDDSL